MTITDSDYPKREKESLLFGFRYSNNPQQRRTKQRTKKNSKALKIQAATIQIKKDSLHPEKTKFSFLSLTSVSETDSGFTTTTKTTNSNM
ncbi:hypothetical protein DERF_000757 [Dermatophagoides farinae]|uniref:Uncharacterized protein n=1 Tax=Dermatophagoides farinae TaxID=6954 RepID=A0A922LAH5_DERFA|nr:hypothetical protein DERF_000757 [Dermatophagoides farinae]